VGKLGSDIKYDLDFLKSHTLQPKWYKILKVFILFGFLLGFYLIFDLSKTALFFACFVAFALAIHFTYRIKTRKYTQSWLDFIVNETGEEKPKRIGKYYYPAIIISAIISFVVSQLLIK
jgi:hypothetical protein